MNIQYQRNLKNSYMIVIEEEQTLNLDGQLAEKMITRQEIPGLLYWVTMENQGDITFWYQITGMQSLADWLQHHPLNFELLGRLLTGLMALQQELPRYYLKCEHLLLQKEQIFIRPGTEEAVFCYEPLWAKEPRESLGGLLEGLLPDIDHNDKEAVRLGYGLYEKCQEENTDIWEYLLQQSFGKKASILDTEAESSDNGWNSGEIQPEKQIQKEIQREKQKEIQREKQKEIQKETTPLLQENFRVKSVGNKMERETDVIDEIRAPLVKAITGKFSDLQMRIPNLHSKKPEKPISYYYEPEEDDLEPEHPTVLLGKNDEAEGRLVYYGDGGEENMQIRTDSFLVGGRNRLADASLQVSGVSRNHARITRDDKTYYVEDLNSRNGTYLNGELLSYKKKYQIRPGDRLKFAREEYVFY